MLRREIRNYPFFIFYVVKSAFEMLKGVIENCKKLSKKYIIFTWSSHGGDLEPDCDPHHQHLNPLSREDYMKLMYSQPNEELTKTFLNHSMNNKHFYYWWRESFVIWEKI